MFKSEWLKRQDILLSFVANSFAAKVLVIVNKIILFWFLFINSGRYNNKKTGDYQDDEDDAIDYDGSFFTRLYALLEIIGLLLFEWITWNIGRAIMK